MNEDKKTGAVTLLMGLVVAVALVFTVVGSGAVDAAKPTGSAGCKGRRCGPSTSAALSVAPNPMPLGSPNVTISGSGFGANQTVLINTSMFPSPEVTANSTGSFSFQYAGYANQSGGTARIEAYVMQNSNWVFVTSTTLTICSTNPC
jgi:hypothetical protein